jgi:hypothetical protein
MASAASHTVHAAKEAIKHVVSSPSFLEDPAGWHRHLLTQVHPLAKDYPLVDPLVMFGLIAAYFLTIFVLIQIMKRREKPVDVYYLALFHNINLTVLSAYMCAEVLRQAYLNGYSFWGNGVAATRHAGDMARIIWIFYASKLLEFLDTVIMCLKKNFHQVSFLHVYHHSSILFIWWIVVFYAPGGESYFSAALNSFVHVVMYGYYLWATFAPKLAEGKRPGLLHPGFYRPYITRIQLLQFCLNFSQSCYDLFVLGDDCKYPRWLIWVLFWYMLTMLGLFGNFYISAYTSKGKGKGKAKKEE